MISVAICTYNNAAKLDMALESLKEMVYPPGLEYEILVIDNNSDDGTQEIVERYKPVWGTRIRYIFEGRQGLSHARNRAMKEAAGDVVSYIDDDIKADPQWLSAIGTAFERYPTAAVVGGRSYLVFPSSPPAWLSEKCELLLSRLDYGDEPIVGTDQDLFGVNFSVRTDWLRRVGGFDPSLGRRGRSLVSGEESDLLRRIRALGGVAVYEPAAVVGHIVSTERLKLRWFLRRFFVAGRESIPISLKDGAPLPSVSQVAIHAARCAGSVLKGPFVGGPSRKILVDKILVSATAMGRLQGRVRLAFRGGGKTLVQGQAESRGPSM